MTLMIKLRIPKSPFGLAVLSAAFLLLSASSALALSSSPSSSLLQNQPPNDNNKAPITPDSTNQNNNPKKKQLRLGLLSFDLDDTLFPTSPVVRDANVVMIDAMRQCYLKAAAAAAGNEDDNGDGATTAEEAASQDSSSIFSIESYTQTSRRVRQSLTDGPITYSELRRRSIREEFVAAMETNGNTDSNPRSNSNSGSNPGSNLGSINPDTLDAMVEHCFDAWLQERHAAAGRRLFEQTIPMLQTIRQEHQNNQDDDDKNDAPPNAPSSSDNSNDNNNAVVIAAITNGRGNPLHMPLLEEYFDFCVSGEDGHVFPHNKPAPGIYHAALNEYAALRPMARVDDETVNNGKEPEETITNDNGVEYVWCHVGDCLANDVGASAQQGAFAVWYNPPSDNQSNTADDDKSKQPSYSSATAKDLEQRAILEQAGKQYVGAEIACLSELPGVIRDYLY